MTAADRDQQQDQASKARARDSKPRIRDAEATRGRILAAAKREFSRLGLAGARVDTIADKARANKRMIYHYFGNKEALFQAVIEQAYVDIRTAETRLNLEDLPPVEALERLVRFTWTYYLDNPEFITLVNSENLHRAKHLKKSPLVQSYSRQYVDLVANILERGTAEGVFREGVNPVQLNITIAAIGYYYLTNRFTGSIIYERDLMDREALDERLRFNIDTILRLVCVRRTP
ncbi:TetR family transcriptional regulator [Paracoccus sp. (in: a-proteobacteria)]|uniref:TetR family transcriptional regulator n=1 Tax=Paracoccus sp. TaxID=267 RepID=UPI003A89EF1C